MITTAVNNLNRVSTFPLPGGKAKISISYGEPEEEEGRIAIPVNGYLTHSEKLNEKGTKKIPFNFSGYLIKSFGTGYKDVSKALTDSLENANEKIGSPIEDVHEFVTERIAKSIPLQAVKNFLSELKNKGKEKEKEKEEPKKEKKEEPKTFKKLNKNQIVEINLKSMSVNDPDAYEKAKEKYPDIVSNPVGVVFDDAGDKVSVIFKNKTFSVIPRKYLKPYQQKKDAIERKFETAHQSYEEQKEKSPEDLNLEFIEAILKYKKAQGIEIDEIDKELLKTKKEEKEKNRSWREKGQSWVGDLVNKGKDKIKEMTN